MFIFKCFFLVKFWHLTILGTVLAVSVDESGNSGWCRTPGIDIDRDMLINDANYDGKVDTKEDNLEEYQTERILN